MIRPDDHDLDRIIEETLHEQPLRSAPAGMCRAIVARLEIVKLIEHERLWLRCSFFLTAGLFSALVVAALFMVAFPQWPSLVAQNIPGAMGYCDYLMASRNAYVILVLLAISPAIPLGATVVLALLPPRRRRFRK